MKGDCYHYILYHVPWGKSLSYHWWFDSVLIAQAGVPSPQVSISEVCQYRPLLQSFHPISKENPQVTTRLRGWVKCWGNKNEPNIVSASVSFYFSGTTLYFLEQFILTASVSLFLLCTQRLKQGQPGHLWRKQSRGAAVDERLSHQGGTRSETDLAGVNQEALMAQRGCQPMCSFHTEKKRCPFRLRGRVRAHQPPTPQLPPQCLLLFLHRQMYWKVTGTPSDL